jgi:DNA mismatch repair protein MutS
MAIEATTALTPLMQQYHSLKSRHPGELLFFRLGDFYELFSEDAQRAAPILGVALTHRQTVPMCGVPAHSIDPYIAKLLRAGQRVAIADQMEDHPSDALMEDGLASTKTGSRGPTGGKGIVRREVVRVITPGTLQEDALLSAKQHNFLAAVYPEGARLGLASIECSTGEFLTTELPGLAESSVLWDELTRLSPSEVVIPTGPDMEKLKVALVHRGFSVAELTPMDFSARVAEERLKSAFKTGSLRGFGLEDKPHALAAAGAVLRYLENTQCGRPFSTKPLRTYAVGDTLQMDAATLEHLDLLPEGGTRPRHSLLEILDQTLTPMGGRLLRRWIVAPLRNVAAIHERQNRVAFFLENKEARRALRTHLQGWPDFERILARLSAGTTAPRDLAHLANGLRRLPSIETIFISSSPAMLNIKHGSPIMALGDDVPKPLFADIPRSPELSALLERAVVDTPPPTMKDGGVIRDGFHAELDEVRSWIRDGKQKLLELEQKEREATGISSLKISFNNVFGYYLEVTKTHLAKVPAHYHRKQTTANGERYITPELKEFENRILGAEERALRLESELVQGLREAILKEADTLRFMADLLAQIDVAQSMAELAERRRYVRPVVDDSTTLIIREGRHPVLEDVLPSGTLVPNDIELNAKNHQILILTGPNMSGKSTYLRQTALISILAQMGSFVPAAEAHVGVLDYLFTRIGASDRLADGESTFMVEMVETARILNHATPRSLVILDEVGRGTSTYDGMSIAGACLEYLRGGPKVLFATHFFELTEMADRFPEIHNAHVSAREWGDEVIFLHKVEPGPADRAYGIHVARLAGVPKSVLDRANVLLASFENPHPQAPSVDGNPAQPSLFDLPNDTLLNDFRQALEGTDLNALTPIQALMLLQTWQTKLKKD